MKAKLSRKQRMLQILSKFVQRKNKIPSLFELSRLGVTRNWIYAEFGNYTTYLAVCRRFDPKAFENLIRRADERRAEIVRKFVEYVRTNKSIPSWEDMSTVGFSRDVIKGIFPRHADLLAAARKAESDAFKDLIDGTIFNRIQAARLTESVGKFSRFVVTTAVVGCPVDEEFLASIQTYCRINSAMLLVLSSADPASKNAWTLDHRIGKEHVVVQDLRLNDNLFVSTIKLSAKHVDPTTGLTRIGQRNGTFIYASPKQRLRCAAMANNRYPHVLMTTGAVTVPQYATDRYMSERTAYVATHDHVVGAVVVEIEDDSQFHFRQIQADRNGEFVDVGYRYSKDGVRKESAAALVMGDWHSGETDPTAKSAWKEVCRRVSPDDLVVHDGFNGKSINHHESKKRLTQALKAQAGELDLKAEVTGFATDLDELSSWPRRRVVVVESNHDQFLQRYLEDGTYVLDPHNCRFAVKLVGDAFEESLVPLKNAVELSGLKNKTKVRWIMADEGYQIAGIELGAHGHIGSNGQRNPGLANIETCYGESVTGHSHTPEILRGAWRVGTSSYLRLSYNEGPSSWLHTSCIVYRNGARQLINSFDGRWTTLDFKKLDGLVQK